MTLSDTAGRVMSLAQSGRADEALTLGRSALRDPGTAGTEERAALWYAVAVAQHVLGDWHAQVEATNQCLELARSVDSPGWMSNALSLRAMALVRANTVEPALLDLAQAEVELAACSDAGLQGWAHTGLGYTYLELRLYELAEPHFEAALAIVISPLSLEEERAIDLMNLGELHLRWADELERATPHDGSDGDAEMRRSEGHAYAVAGYAEAQRIGATALAEACRAMELCSRPRGRAEASLADLEAAWDSPDHTEHHGGRATVGGAFARALWRTGNREKALEVARSAAADSVSAGDWQVTAGVRWLLVEMEVLAGVPGAASGRAYGQLLSGVLWQQRLSTLQGATAALDVERLRHDKVAAQRAAQEDPLTGVGNRRALSAALAEIEVRAVQDERPTSLLIVDLDRFKEVNDNHGHVVGDDVLRAVADAMRSVARSDDLVARLGGDEFVLL
ncbi:MAG: GGDEF domain-containing protein, partial [Nocardioidaceae bacterium]|nr:GGDEF domain-containing protein [Nocardioidaceae bacterium]